MWACIPVKADPFACALFTYNGNVVAIDLVGAGIPLALSLVFAVRLLVRGGFHVRPRRLAIFTALTVGLGLAAAGEYTVWDSLYGGLAINTRLILYTVILPVGLLGTSSWTGRASRSSRCCSSTSSGPWGLCWPTSSGPSAAP